MPFLTMLAQNALCMSLVIAVILLARPLMEKHSSPRARHLMWCVVLIGLLLPFRIVPSKPLWVVNAPEAIAPIRYEASMPVSGERLLDKDTLAARQAAVAQSQAADSITQTASSIALAMSAKPKLRLQMPDLYTLALIVWGAGAAIMLLIQVTRHLRFFQSVRRWRKPPTKAQGNALAMEAAQLGIRRPIPLYRCACASSPMVIGLARPVMLMPEIELTADELRLILKHELTHVKRRDLWVKAFMLLALIVHWFNPLVYVMARAMASDCEMSCDASVLASTDLQQRKRYGETILGVIRRQRKRHVALSTYFYEGKKDMKKRFVSMLDMTKRRGGAALVALTLVLTLMSGNLVAIAQPEDKPTAKAASAAPADWERHKTPDIFGITTQMNPENYEYRDYETGVLSRHLTRAEIIRLSDLYYRYDAENLRAQAPVTVGQGEGFTLSMPLEDLCKLIRMENGHPAAQGMWEDAKQADALPFLRFPVREMNDTELLELIELIDAFELLVPYYDPWEMGDDNPNRRLTRGEMIRLAIVREKGEADPSYRPLTALTTAKTDGLYIKGYNGGGETVFHYPEDRELTEEELKQIVYISIARNEAYQASQAAQQSYEQPKQTVGAEQEAETAVRAILGDVNVRLTQPNHYNDSAKTWNILLSEDVPTGAGGYSYCFDIDMATGKLTWFSQEFYPFVNQHSFLLPMDTLPIETEYAKDISDPHWVTLARKYLDTGLFYGGAEVASIAPTDDYSFGANLRITYADGTKALMVIDAATDALSKYFIQSDEAPVNE